MSKMDIAKTKAKKRDGLIFKNKRLEIPPTSFNFKQNITEQ